VANLGQYAQPNQQLGSITGTQLPAQVSYRPPQQSLTYQPPPSPAPTVTTAGFGAAQPSTMSYGAKSPVAAPAQYQAAPPQPPGYGAALQSLLRAQRPQTMAQRPQFAPSAYGGNGNAANQLNQQAALDYARRGY